jgi:glycosyltransferase involved in cell wall biosynthesis
MADIAIFLPSLGSGGAEKMMLNLAHGLAARGCAVEMVLVRKEGGFISALSPDVCVIDLKASRALAALPALVGYLRRNRPKVFLSNLPHLNMLAVMARALARVLTRLVLVEHNDLQRASAHGVRRWERFFPTAVGFFHRRADAVVAVSQGVADGLVQLAGLPRGHITVIHNPIVTSDIDLLAAEPLEHPWFAKGQPPVILAVGRLTLQKDYPTLLQAIAAIHARRPVRLIILGEGTLLNEMQSLANSLGIAPDVDFVGFDPNPLRYMARCAVFTLSSAWEGFGNVLVEALACGAQVVSTDCPSGPAEILAGGRYGRLVPVGDPAGFASAIESAMQNPLPADVLKRRASDFHVDLITKQYLEVLFPPGNPHV